MSSLRRTERATIRLRIAFRDYSTMPILWRTRSSQKSRRYGAALFWRSCRHRLSFQWPSHWNCEENLLEKHHHQCQTCGAPRESYPKIICRYCKTLYSQELSPDERLRRLFPSQELEMIREYESNFRANLSGSHPGEIETSDPFEDMRRFIRSSSIGWKAIVTKKIINDRSS